MAEKLSDMPAPPGRVALPDGEDGRAGSPRRLEVPHDEIEEVHRLFEDPRADTVRGRSASRRDPGR